MDILGLIIGLFLIAIIIPGGLIGFYAAPFGIIISLIVVLIAIKLIYAAVTTPVVVHRHKD